MHSILKHLMTTRNNSQEMELGAAPELGATLPQALYGQLREKILTGALKVGQALRQEELARHFRVSRVPLREALSRLQADGLIEARPHRGFAVTALHPDQIVEVFELRMAIEEHAGCIAARERTPADIAEVEAVLKQMESLNPKSPDYQDRWARLNYDFHSRIIASSGRMRLARIAGNLRSAVEPYVRMELGITGDVEDAEREHRKIFKALRAGDAKGLAQLSRAHVEGTARRLLKGLREGTPSRSPRVNARRTKAAAKN
jgi:DNA-binding GntR family transcriptional regulator